MPPKKAQQKQAGSYKVGAQLKDVIPVSEKNQPRNARQNKQIEPVTEIPRENQYESFVDIEEWPGEEKALQFDFGLNGNTIFSEEQQVVKQYFQSKNFEEKVLFWRRPLDFVKLEQEEKANVREMMAYRRRQSFTSNIGSSLQNENENKIIDDNLIYSKNKVDLTSQEELDEQQQQQLLQQNQKAKDSKGKQQESQQQQQNQGNQLDLKVFETFEREETQEEMETRIKLQELKAQDTKKGAKKAPKKGEEQVEGPKTIKDIKISSIDMSTELLDDCKWIASQFQLIRDRNLRDCKTGKPIWSKIYPQQDGVPIYNPSGKYWVNLYYMGKERKIEIDDKMPVDFKGQCYFPRSIKKQEIWVYLLSKAILKLILQTQRVDQQSSLTGSGFVNYALTGMLSQTIPINTRDQDMNQDSIYFINKLLSESHFIENDAFITCYCEPDFKPSAESNIKKEVKDYYIDRLRVVENIAEESEDNFSDSEQGSQYDQKVQQNSVNSLNKIQDDRNISPMKKKTQNKYIPETYDSPSKMKEVFNKNNKIETLNQKPTYVIPGFSYPIIECFRNENFNMVYVQKRSEREIKLRQEYHEVTKVSMNKFTKDEKLEHRRRKKELKEKISECDKQRVELITKPPIQYQLFRIKTNAGRCPLLNIVCPFNNEEINIAKTCLQNNLSKPPNYELPEIRDDGKSMISTVKQQDDSFVMKPLDDFSAVAHLRTPMNRGLGGNWVKFSDLQGCFQYFQIFYNPNKLNQNKDVFVKHNPDYELTLNDQNEILLISRKEKEVKQEQGDEEQNENNDSLQNLSVQKMEESKQILEQEDVIKFLFGFQYEEAKNKQIIPSPYCILQKFDFSLFDSVHDYPPLRLKQQSQMLQLENKNQVFKIMACSPLSYMINLACDSQIESMSISDYLTKYENWTPKQIKIEYMPVEKDTYNNLVRFKISPFENENTFILKLNSTDNNMLKYYRFKILEQPQEDGTCYMLENNEGVIKNIYESNYEMQQYLRVTLKANTTYHLLLEGMTPYNLASGTLDCDFYMQQAEQQIEQIDLVEPLEYFDKYTPYKYGILFREKLYSGDNTISSVFLRLGQIEDNQQNQQQDKDKKGAKKGAVQESNVQEQPLQEQRKVILELFEDEKLIQFTTGYNTAYFSNILLQNNNLQEGKKYYLQARFDLRDWEECKIVSPETQGIHWFLKIQSSDTLGIVKDTAKEDREKAVAKSWEEGEPGRAVKAVNARKKFALLQKQKNGEQLTEEELEILNEPRLTKKQKEEENQQGAKGGKKAPPKKDDKKQAKKGGKAQKESQIYEKQIEVEKSYPQSKDHRMKEIRGFLKHMEEERVKEVLAQHQGLINVRSEENKQEIARQAEISVQRLEQILNSSKDLRDQLSLLQNDQKAQILKQFAEKSQITKQQWEQYQQQREETKNSLTTKNTKEKELFDICQAENPNTTLENLEKLIEEAKAVPEINSNLIELSYRVLKNLKINALNDKFTNALSIFDTETLKNCIQEYNDFSVTGIDSDIIEKSEAMIQEASENPNFQAEKAAELKKAGKKGKK